MKIILNTIVVLAVSIPSSAKIDGVATKISLLQQLQSSLEISVQRMNLPSAILGKFPVTNEVQEVKPSFLSAWTQATFLACGQAIRSGTVPVLEKEVDIKLWIKSLGQNSWGMDPADKEIGEIYKATFGDLAERSPKEKTTFACSMVLNSPNVYMIGNLEGDK